MQYVLFHIKGMHTFQKSNFVIYVLCINMQTEPFSSARNFTRILLTNPKSGYLVLESDSAEFWSPAYCLVGCSLFPVDNASTSENLNWSFKKKCQVYTSISRWFQCILKFQSQKFSVQCSVFLILGSKKCSAEYLFALWISLIFSQHLWQP